MKYVVELPPRYGITSEDYGADVLRYRGIKDVHEFLFPTQENLQSWKDLDNINKGIDLLLSHKDGLIGLIVDCDVDGYTSSAILYQYLVKNLNANIKYYIHEGKQHGLSDKIDEILEQDEKLDLLIIPDAGSNDYTYIEQLKEVNIPVLILDHHLLEGQLSDNCVLINNQTSWMYNNKDLSGAGVTFQFLRGLDDKLGLHDAWEYIDLAALGVCADMMSALSIENQYLWHEGFSDENRKNFFFSVLCDKQAYSMKDKVNPTTVAFYIVPLINAMIRIGSQEEKERLFLAFVDGHRMVESHKRGAKGQLEYVAVESCRECVNAKAHQDKKKKEIAENLEIKICKNGLLDNKVLFIRLDDDDDFPAVLNGLVCMQLAAKYNRPTIVARLNPEGYVRGSARGLNKSELTSFKNFLNDSGLFEYTIGHDQAFGVSINNENLKNFHEYANKQLESYDFDSNMYSVCYEVNGDSIELAKMIKDIVEYENVWGQMNELPLIAVNNIYVNADEIQVMGRNNDTVKFKFNNLEYIKFFAKDIIPELLKHDHMRINLIGKPSMNEWMGARTPQIMIEDLEIFNSELDF